MAPASAPTFAPDDTPDGELPPWEVAKAFAFKIVLDKVSATLKRPASKLVGQPVPDYIASQLTLQGGSGSPTARAVQKVLSRCKDPRWYPGKPSNARSGAGRKPLYTEHVQNEIARVGMDLKQKRQRPMPRRVRQRLNSLARNPETGKCISDKSVQRIFGERCYDETEDDPWQYLSSVSQDCLAEHLKPLRVDCAKHILANFNASSHHNQLVIDPCYSLLAKTQEKLEEQQVAAMGKKKWQSKKSARIGVNPRAPATAKTQASNSTRVDCTQILARGSL